MHFAPTQKAADALLKEGKDPEQIFVTGNTGIDACTIRCEMIFITRKQNGQKTAD
ncbi:MAG: UDP-N-acetylglucosamine 2-epimerase [Ruminococcus sp.]